METKKSYFQQLNSINCNEHTEKKNGLTYLSWAWAWAKVKNEFPDAFYTVYENPELGLPYFTDGHTAMVKASVTINGLEHPEWLPIMDYRNVSIPVDKVTSMDVNKAIQRALTKACARHGLGLYIYAGEDLPEDAPEGEATPAPAPKKAPQKAAKKPTVFSLPEGVKGLSREQYNTYVRNVAVGLRSQSEVEKGFREACGADDVAIGLFRKDVNDYTAAMQ